LAARPGHPPTYALLKCLGKAFLKHGPKAVADLVPFGGAAYEIARDAWDEYQRDQHQDALRTELEALAQASPAETRSAVDQVVEENARGEPATVREAMASFLTEVPAAIRRSLRRPSSPLGTTFAAGETLRGADDLVRFLPRCFARFKPGDRPLPGVDLVLEELIGVGGFGEVWKARNPNMRNQPPVALKFCLDTAASSALRNEAGVLDRVMKHGRHPGIVPLLQTYLSAEPPFLQYEYVEGGDLSGLIQEMHARGRAKADVANRLVLRLAEIVGFAHRASPPIVHGDLKPANILVRRNAGGKVALRITDFGIGGLAAALSVEQQPHSHGRQELLTQSVRGAYTPLYASPQQRERRPGEAVDPRDDIHALGVIWFQLLTGDLQMTSIPTDWREQATERGLSNELIDLLGQCFSPKPEKRPANAAVLAEQLRAALAAASPNVEDGFVVLELIEEPAATVPAPPEPVARTKRPTQVGGTRRPSSLVTNRPRARTLAQGETTKTAGSAWNAVGNLGLAAGALVLIVSLALVAGLVLIWSFTRGSGHLNSPPEVAQAKDAQMSGPPGGKTVANPLAPAGNAPAPQAPQPAQLTPAELAKKLADEQAAAQKAKDDAQALAELRRKEEAARLLAEEQEAAAELARKAEAEKQRLAEQQEKDARQAKIIKAVEEARVKVYAKSPKERQAGIVGLAQLGRDAASADYDLCQLIAFDPVPDLRRNALDALEKVQPNLYPLAVTFSLPVENNSPGGYKKAIVGLPAFGRAGVPLIAAQLYGSNPHVAILSRRFPAPCTVLLDAHIDVLSTIAANDNAAFDLLLAIPDSPLAMATKQHKQIDGAYLDASLRKNIAGRLLPLGTLRPETRKKSVPFLTAVAQLAGGNSPNDMRTKARIAGIDVLAKFGPDAASALPALRSMKLDPSEQVRTAVANAIAVIEKKN
jgi:serine/threonine protein kinase